MRVIHKLHRKLQSMILKTQPVTKRNTYFCGDIQSNLTGQRSNSITIQVSDVQRKVQSECL